MHFADSRTFRVITGTISALTLAMVWVAYSAHGQGLRRLSLPQDWSHHHLIFTPPSSAEQAWRLRQDPRFWHQVLRRTAAARQQDEESASDFVGKHVAPGHGRKNLEHPDWGMSLLAGGKAGAGGYPAKFTFDINATPDCINDYVAFTTSLAGSTTQPSIIAVDELYSTQGRAGGLCNQNGPSVKWAYNTGTGRVLTSPVLSGDGTQIAYVDTAAGGAILHILKWKPGATATVQGTLNAPATPDTTLAAGAAWSTCPAANSCVANIAFGTATQDTNSSPFYNYATDELYVGDDKGNLHKFTGVFSGTPAEAGAPWPVALGNKNILNSPVFDSATSKVFVGDSGGVLYSVSSTGVSIASNRVAFRSGFVDGPIVDSSHSVSWIGLYGRKHARAILPGLRKVFRPHRNSFGQFALPKAQRGGAGTDPEFARRGGRPCGYELNNFQASSGDFTANLISASPIDVFILQLVSASELPM